MTDNPYLRAKQHAEQAKHYQPVQKDQVPQSFLKNLAATYTRTSRTKDVQPIAQANKVVSPYTSAQLSPAEIRRRQKAEIEQKLAADKQVQRAQEVEEKRLQLQYRQEQQLIDNFLRNIRQLEPMHPDRRWFEDYKDSCPNERQAALDLIKLKDS